MMITTEDINEIVRRINDQIYSGISRYIGGDHPFDKNFYQIKPIANPFNETGVIFNFMGASIWEFDFKYDKNMPKTELEDLLKMKILEIKNVFNKIKLKLE